MTPAKLAALADALRLPLKEAQALAAQSPLLLAASGPQLQACLAALTATLQLKPRQAAYMLSRAPALYLQTDPLELRRRAEALAALTGVSLADVVAWACGTPRLLARAPELSASRLAFLSALFGLPARDTIALVASVPQYLTASRRAVVAAVAALARVLALRRVCVVRLLQRQPDAVCMSPRIMCNKLRVSTWNGQTMRQCWQCLCRPRQCISQRASNMPVACCDNFFCPASVAHVHAAGRNRATACIEWNYQRSHFAQPFRHLHLPRQPH